MLGDSVAYRFLPTAREALWNEYRVVDFTLAACEIVPVELRFTSDDEKAACAAHRQDVMDQIAATRPDVVFIEDTYSTPNRFASLAAGDAAVAEWRAALDTLLVQLKPSVGRTILVSPPAEGKDLAACATNVSSPADCVSTWATSGPRWPRRNAPLPPTRVRCSGTPRSGIAPTGTVHRLST